MKDKNEKVFRIRSSKLQQFLKKLRKIPVFYCFTKEYQEKIAYREFLQKHLNDFKLNMEEEKTREEEPFYYEDEEDIPYPESWF